MGSLGVGGELLGAGRMTIDRQLFDVSTLMLLGVVILGGFFMGRVVRRANLPSLVGYMLFGILIGPSLLNLFNRAALDELSFLAEIGLGFVALTIGTELSVVSLRRLGWSFVVILFAECVCSFLVVFGGVYLVSGDLPLALLMGAMAPATAPAGTVAVIQECRASGSLTRTIYAVAGFDDGVAVIIYGFAMALVKNLLVGQQAAAVGIGAVLSPALWEIGRSLLLGGVLGLLFCQVVRRFSRAGDILILLCGIVFLAVGLAIHWHLSLIIVNMTIGFLLVNSRGESLMGRVHGPLLEILPLVFVLFFCLAGAHLDLGGLPAMGLLGVVYIVSRTAGKVFGAGLGAAVGGVESKIKKYLGWAILSQAGVAIGLALLASNDLALLAERYQVPHAAAIGAMVLATITTSSVVFELVGPLLTRVALRRAGEVSSPDGIFMEER